MCSKAITRPALTPIPLSSHGAPSSRRLPRSEAVYPARSWDAALEATSFWLPHVAASAIPPEGGLSLSSLAASPRGMAIELAASVRHALSDVKVVMRIVPYIGKFLSELQACE